MTDESSVNPQEDGSKTAARRTVHEWLEDALGRFQVTHCHSSIKEALKEMERTDVDLANELAASPVVQSRESTLPELDEPECFSVYDTFTGQERSGVSLADYDRCLTALTAARAQENRAYAEMCEWVNKYNSMLVQREQLSAQLAEMKQQARWRSVESELPQDGQRVLVTDGSNWSAETYPNQLARMMNPDPKEWFDCPTTHWQPYPELPTASLKQNEETV